MLFACYRERREADVRELEKAKIEQLEKQRAAEQAAAAVHKHFEESFRVAKQKVSHALFISEWCLFFITLETFMTPNLSAENLKTF